MTEKVYLCTLAEVRDDHGITLQELADAIGVSRQALSAIEKNISEPGITTVLKIADYFSIPVEALFEEKSL
ncbi:helix-turn-helix domain-containing protein, partial [bacterium]|jgi:DNA-binding XRE family transcriptional regulator|nr:helix-turn-helix domain-containing protein [bacterium]